VIQKRQRRALGMGRLWKRQQAGRAVWVADWKDADGARHRRVLSTDRRVAERKMAEIIRQRDLVACGLAVEDGLDLGFDDIVAEYLADLRSRPGNRLDQLIAAGHDNPALVGEVYWATLSRPPSEVEQVAAVAHLDSASTNRRAAAEDLLWSLINSAEFLLRR